MLTRVLACSALGFLATTWCAGADEKTPEKSPPKAPAAAAPTEGKPAEKAQVKSEEKQPSVTEQEAEDKASPEEKAIREIVRQTEAAFNAHDSKQLLTLFSEEAEVISAGGQITRGREDIQGIFDGVFEEHPEVSLSIEVESVRVLGRHTAIEEGISRITNSPDSEVELSRYSVVYEKDGEAWKVVSARDVPLEEAVNDHLEQLGWLVGDWLDECPEAIVKTRYRWSDSRRFIIGEFRVNAPEEGELDGTIHIGWDPQLKQLRSWVFDSEGGYSTGVWARNEDTWVVKLTGVLADGRTTTATHRLHRHSEDHATLESSDRVIGGVLIDDAEPVEIVRRGPAPEALSEVKQ